MERWRGFQYPGPINPLGALELLSRLLKQFLLWLKLSPKMLNGKLCHHKYLPQASPSLGSATLSADPVPAPHPAPVPALAPIPCPTLRAKQRGTAKYFINKREPQTGRLTGRQIYAQRGDGGAQAAKRRTTARTRHTTKPGPGNSKLCSPPPPASPLVVILRT